MKILTHIDLFSGIGGFSIAFDNVFHEQKNTHIFCEIDPFCQAVLRKHWPDSLIFDDIKTFADTRSKKPRRLSNDARKALYAAGITDKPFLLTGGFPCQPFSQAGRRKGTNDDRHLWPFMFEIIRSWKPTWVIAENVRGLLTIGGGMVFEQVCADLESAGYEVQPIVIPAVAVNAPHRRDRVWFVANRKDDGSGRRNDKESRTAQRKLEQEKQKRNETRNQGEGCNRESPTNAGCVGSQEQSKQAVRDEQYSWEANWLEVATRLCRVDDGVRTWMDGSGKVRNSRNPRLKSLGNAIVPQVAMEIMQAIKNS